MEFNDLLTLHGYDPERVRILRHRPQEPELRRVLPWLAAERSELFNAYQQFHAPRVESALEKAVGNGYVASFIGDEPARALFVGLFAVTGSKPIASQEEFWEIPAYRELRKFGMWGWREGEDRRRVLWFDLEPVEDFYPEWKGRLIIDWTGGERSWYRRAHTNAFPVRAILEESKLAPAMPSWEELVFTWGELHVLPRRWREALSQWRGIYYIFDTSDGLGYVGSAYGEENILGRSKNYAATGHGGNQQLRRRDPADFVFFILQRVSPDMNPADVISLEGTWKERLHTREYGLNEN